MNRQSIEDYAAGAELLARAIEGLTRGELLAVPVPGTWSIQQIVVHMMDSDLIGSDRMKRVLAEEHPTLLAYDETAFANRLGYELVDTAMACEVFRLNRVLTADLLRRQPDAAFQRTGNHTEHGEESLARLVASYHEHLHHHLKFIRDKRAMLGKPLASSA